MMRVPVTKKQEIMIIVAFQGKRGVVGDY
jgi:hypothetical protein